MFRWFSLMLAFAVCTVLGIWLAGQLFIGIHGSLLPKSNDLAIESMAQMHQMMAVGGVLGGGIGLLVGMGWIIKRRSRHPKDTRGY